MYGHAGLEADVEIVGLMIAALKRAGIERVHIDLGHPTIYRALSEKSGLNAEDSEALFHAVQQKDAPAEWHLENEDSHQHRDGGIYQPHGEIRQHLAQHHLGRPQRGGKNLLHGPHFPLARDGERRQ